MSGGRVLRSKTNKNKTIPEYRPIVVPTGCANWSKGKSTLSKDFHQFDFEEEVTLTIQEILEKVFRVTFDPMPNTIQICRECGLQLLNLYKCYEEFLQLCAIDSILSKFIKTKTNFSNNSPPRPLKLRIKIPKGKCKSVPKKNKSKLKKAEEDVSENIAIEVGEDHDLKIDMSMTPWDSFGPMDDNDNMDDIDIEDMKPSPLTFLSDQDIQETEIHLPSLISGIETKTKVKGISESTTQSQSEEFDLSERLERVVENSSEKLKKQRTCPICNKTYNRPIKMRVHLTRTHFVECGVPADKLVRIDTPQDCRICGKTLASKQSLRSHIKYFHEKQRNHTCTVCNKAFNTRSILKLHWNTHTDPGLPGQKTALCSVCGRTFGSTGSLRSHFERHFSNSDSISSKYKFKCKICGKAFLHASRLKDHMLTHENQRTFICDICGDSFNTSRSLRKHRAAHIDQFPCPYCERHFKRKAALKDHLIFSAHALSLEEARAAAGISAKRIEIAD